jgi:predicted HicB family RNase H-like nuclease
MKKRLMIQLEPEDHRALRSWARAAGVSMSGAVRRLWFGFEVYPRA